jgi:hypothetical protein
MTWLSELSIYRGRINKIKKDLQDMKLKVFNSSLEDRCILIMQDIRTLYFDVDATEQIIICIIKNNMIPNYYSVQVESEYDNGEDELFKKMKFCYNSLLELESKFYYFSNEAVKLVSLQQPSKVIQLQPKKADPTTVKPTEATILFDSVGDKL